MTTIFDQILPAINAETPYDRDMFIQYLQRLYSLPYFKPYLDLILTKLQSKNIQFRVVAPREKGVLLRDTQEGICETMQVGVYDTLRNKIFRQYAHLITIRKNTPNVIIHEMAHALEKESKIDIRQGFMQALHSDFQAKRVTNYTILQAIEHLMHRELSAYKPAQQNGELFARYFEIFAMTKEIAGYNSSYDVRMADVEKFFVATQAWTKEVLEPILHHMIDGSIARDTSRLISERASVSAPQWKETIRPRHTDSGAVNAPKPVWRKDVKSLFKPDDKPSNS